MIEFESNFMTTKQEQEMERDIDYTLEEEFQIWLEDAITPKEGDSMRTQDLRELINNIHSSAHNRGYAELGEYLYHLAYDALVEYNLYNQSQLERD